MFGNTPFIKRIYALMKSAPEDWTYEAYTTVGKQLTNDKARVRILKTRTYNYETEMKLYLNDVDVSLKFWEKIKLKSIFNKITKEKIISNIENASSSPIVKENIKLKKENETLKLKRSKFFFISKEQP